MLETSHDAAPRSRHDAVADHQRHYDRAESVPIATNYDRVIRQFYDLVTDFYELGWGRSFHFAPWRRGESLEAAIARFEDLVADKLALRRGMRAIDLGCGVGGPMRRIAQSSGAHVTGVNINGYQVEKARRYNERAGLSHACEVIEADFLHIPVPDESFDAAYAFEATCHAPSKHSVYGEAARVLKPGGHLVVSEWCITPAYDEENPEHRRVRQGIERGNGLTRLSSFEEVHEALERCGLTLLEARDRAADCDPERPWYAPLSGVELSLRSLPRLPYGRVVVNALCGLLERVRLAPRGTREVSALLNHGADNLVAGGKLGIFTPMYFFVAKKPG